jgi:hypothetical protein
MYRVLSILVLSVSLFSCHKKPSCDLAAKYSKIVGVGVAKLFDCKKPDLIALALADELEKLKLCENVQTGPIAAVICKPASVYVTTLIVDKALPKKWECAGGVASGGIETAVYTACNALPF